MLVPGAPIPADRPARAHPRRGAWAAALMLAAMGCGGGEVKKIAFDEISRLPQKEQLVEVKLGSFLVPIPLDLYGPDEPGEVDNLLQLDFDLYAIVSPGEARRVRQLKRRNENRIRAEVIRVCRNTSRDDLLEAEWSTLKAHLLDATQPLLGGDAVRRLATPRIVKELL